MALQLQGLDAVKRAIAMYGKRYPQATAHALYAEGFALQAEAQRRTPIEFGVLRNSAYTAPPSERSLVAEVGFGTEYAITQHERTELRHPRGGEAKYLENAIGARSAGMAERLAQRIARLAKSEPGAVVPQGNTRPIEARRVVSARVRRLRRRRR